MLNLKAEQTKFGENAQECGSPTQVALPARAYELQPLAEHLIRLPQGRWALWRCVCLRGAGFPASQVLRLSANECAAAVDELFKAEDAANGLLVQALEALEHDLPRCGADHKNILLNAMRRLRSGKLPRPIELDCASRSAVSMYQDARRRIDCLWADVRESFSASSLHLSREIREQAQTELFRQAVIWQNRRAVHSGVDSLLRKPAGYNSSKQRRNEGLVANYLQRYCMKNDTIGFFGPVGWSRIVDSGEAIVARPGKTLIAARKVFFEVWCIDALASVLNIDESLKPWIAPRLMPFARVEGATLYLPDKKSVELSPEQAAILRICDGNRTAKEIAADLMRGVSPALKSEDAAYDLLELLKEQGLIWWALEVPITPNPEQQLRRLLERIEDQSLREATGAALDKMESARINIARATGNAEELDRAMNNLEATFTALTDLNASRHPGEMYAGRTLVYEDCRRDIEIDIGPQIIESLGPPLSLILASARWFTFEAAKLYRKTFDEVYEQLVAQSGSHAVDLTSFWYRIRKLIFDDEKRPADSLLRTLQARWSSILSIPPGESRVNIASEQLHPLVLESFAAPCPGWSLARHHSPDIMIAASSLEAIRRGQYQLVLAEIHIAVDTLDAWTFVVNHPSPEKLFAAFELDMKEPRVVPIIPKDVWGQCSRVTPAMVGAKDIRIEFSHDPSDTPREKTFPVSAFLVERSDAGLVVRTRDWRYCFDLIETFALILTANVSNSYRLLSPCSHTPRITFDRLIVSRESWSLFPTEIEFAFEKDAASRFVAARRWASKNGLPRFVFFKAPLEIKPVFVDFDSPIYVDSFARAIRRTKDAGGINQLIHVSEMVPDPTQLWLPDAQGHRYTSEFRIVALDLSA